MNEWAKKSVKLATESNYLDVLHNIYPIEVAERDIDQSILDKIKKLYKLKDCNSLLTELLSLSKFPYDDSYVSFLRMEKSSIDRNPDTVKRICNTLFEMGIENVIDGISAPKKSNQRRGQSFGIWTKKTFNYSTFEEFKKSKTQITFLQGSENDLIRFCNNELKAGLQKKPDFVAKSGRKYVIGEAKFLSSAGGNQDKGFQDAVMVASNPAKDAYKVSILDGIVWIPNKSNLYKSIENSNLYFMSALLLSDFLRSIENE